MNMRSFDPASVCFRLAQPRFGPTDGPGPSGLSPIGRRKAALHGLCRLAKEGWARPLSKMPGLRLFHLGAPSPRKPRRGAQS